MKHLLILLTLITLTSCLPFRAKKSAKKEHPITKCEKKLNKLTKKCPELLTKKDTLNIDTTSITNKAIIQADTASVQKQIADALELFKKSIDSISSDCDSLLNGFTRTLKGAGKIVYECKLKAPIYRFQKLKTKYGYIYLSASIYQIGNEILSTIKIDSSNLVLPTIINEVPKKKELQNAHVKGYEQGALVYEGKFKVWRKIGIGLFMFLILLLAAFGALKYYRII